jgi:hypothetical protein
LIEKEWNDLEPGDIIEISDKTGTSYIGAKFKILSRNIIGINIGYINVSPLNEIAIQSNYHLISDKYQYILISKNKLRNYNRLNFLARD